MNKFEKLKYKKRILPKISKDIMIYQVKEQSKVKAYFNELTRGKDEKRCNQLAEYLVSPVKSFNINHFNKHIFTL